MGAARRQILLISHSPAVATGYGRVTRRLAHAFAEHGHGVTVVGAGNSGDPHELPYLVLPWNNLDAGPVVRAINDRDPDVMLTIGDPWMFDFLPSLSVGRALLWVAYFPLDGFPVPERWRNWIRAPNVPVVFSRFAEDLVAGSTGLTPRVIYHGVDTQSFTPREKQQAKQTANVRAKFVVGTVARNQQRKNLPALVKAFAQFAADKPDAILYLHTQVQGDYDMLELVRRFGIEEKTRVTASLGTDRGVPDAQLATVYNAMDLFVLPTMAEGFGLPIIESQACGTPALVTDFSACPELVPDPIQRLKVKDTLVMRRNLEQAIVDVDDIAAKLEYFYTHRDELADLGKRCHQFAQQFDWSIACNQFVELLASLDVPKTHTKTEAAPDPARGPRGPSPAAPFSAELVAASPSSVACPGLSCASPILTGKVSPDQPQNDVAGIHRLAMARAQEGHGDEAVALLRRAVELRPDDAELHNDLAVALEGAGQPQEAVGSYQQALQRRPRAHQIWTNLSNAYLSSADSAAALQAVQEAVRLRPSYAPAHNALGSALMAGGEVGGARVAFRDAVRLKPDFADAHVNLGLALLASGDLEKGWPEHEWRLTGPSAGRPRISKSWEGSDPFGRSIRLYAEGGLGNVIQFVRYAKVLAERGAIVTVECHPALADLVRTVPGVRQLVTRSHPPAPDEIHCALMSVPSHLKTTIQSIPAPVPYLHPDEQLVEKWKDVVGKIPGFRIGVCWRGDQRVARLRGRSFDPVRMLPLAQLPGVTLINLQQGGAPPDELPLVTLPGLEPESMRLLDVAAVMKNLDLVITCDTAIAHLAGALAVPVWVALKYDACWRWMLNRDDSPWYPTMKLFRQEKEGVWGPVFERMAEQIAARQGVQSRERLVETREPTPVSSNQPNQRDAIGDVFGYFGRARVLNLDFVVDRMKRVSARLDRLGIPFERVPALTPTTEMRPKDPRYGAGAYACAVSHKAILQQAWESGEDRILVFEDDVVLRDDAMDWLSRIVPQLQSVPWDLFYLGVNLVERGEQLGANLWRVNRGYHAHAYAVSRKAMRRVIDHADRIVARLEGTFDGFEDRTLLKVCADPILAVQEPNYSRTCDRQVDRLGEYFAAFDREEFIARCAELRARSPRSLANKKPRRRMSERTRNPPPRPLNE